MQNKQNSDLVYGLHPVLQALESDIEVNKVFVQDGLSSDGIKDIIRKAKERGIYIQYVPKDKLNRLTTRIHQGVVIQVSPVTYYRVDDLLPRIVESGEPPFLIILDRVTDVRNFGAIARTAYCAGAHGIIVPSQKSALVTGDSLKASAGALTELPICREENLYETIKYLKNSGLTIIGASEHTNENFYKADLSMPLAIILGSEEDGISPAYLKMCDLKLSLPIAGNVGSLNVSVAAGIMIYGVLRNGLVL